MRWLCWQEELCACFARRSLAQIVSNAASEVTNFLQVKQTAVKLMISILPASRIRNPANWELEGCEQVSFGCESPCYIIGQSFHVKPCIFRSGAKWQMVRGLVSTLTRGGLLPWTVLERPWQITPLPSLPNSILKTKNDWGEWHVWNPGRESEIEGRY